MTPTGHAAEQRLLELNLVLPLASGPAGNYAPAVRSGNLLFLSGKAPVAEGAEKPKGQLGRDYTAEDGYRLARAACLDLLSALQAALGSLDKVSRIIELHGALNATVDFEDHARVLDGASDLLVEVFGPAGVPPSSAHWIDPPRPLRGCHVLSHLRWRQRLRTRTRLLQAIDGRAGHSGPLLPVRASLGRLAIGTRSAAAVPGRAAL
ncbi:MAG: hypothetical protein CFE45_07680 [Burkholderiales bacterium PBB5]|nr:MAG: hypothetical protein CFE45_07680 [Burkholderiales bacterium PBB5]